MKCWVFTVVVVVAFLSATSEARSETKVVVNGVSSSSCSKQAILFDWGGRHAERKRDRPLKMYSGPSVLCAFKGRLNSNKHFVVVGKQTSAFNKPWYQIEISDTQDRYWVAGKYLSIGEPIISPIVDKAIPIVRMSAAESTNVRQCPNVRCESIGQLKKSASYRVTRKAENGWLFVAISDWDEGWVNGKYLVKKAAKKKETAKKKQAAIVNPPKVVKEIAKPKIVEIEPIKPSISPCDVKPRVEYYSEKQVWRTNESVRLEKAAHEQCGQSFDLAGGKVVVSIGETDEYFLLAGFPNQKMEEGFLMKSAFSEQLEPKFMLGGEDDVGGDEWRVKLLEREAYWNSFRFTLDTYWQTIQNWVDKNKSRAICLFSFFLGSALLLFGRSRQLLLNWDQLFIRSSYFMARSPSFWRMMRKLIFIITVAVVCVTVLYFYVSWLLEVANKRQMIMGLGSLALMSVSLGMFAVRLAAFFVGLVFFFLSFAEFIVFIWFVCFLFLLPSLCLLVVYYLSYKQQSEIDQDQPSQFDRDEIERIHEKLFRLRNFYPETVINWSREGGLKHRWEQCLKVIRARSNPLDAFFNSFGCNAQRPS